MQKYNAIVVFNKQEDKMLMCKRRKNPYKGLLNFVGGKREQNESGLDAAYRELEEETAITKEDIKLVYLMELSYPFDNCDLEIYVGKLNNEVAVDGDENELVWTELDQNFFDTTKYAGEGNIGHIMLHVKRHKKELTESEEKKVPIQMETSRLILREMNMSDYDALYAVLADSDIMQHYPYTFDEKRVRGWIDKNRERYRIFGFGLWAVCLKETGEMIGDCGLTMQNINGAIKPEIGYHIRADRQRNGYAKEAAIAVRDWTAANEKIIPWSIRKCDYHNFETYLDALEEKEESGEKVPDSTISKEPDGEFNESYCKWCYTDGEFKYSSMEELIDFCVEHMSNENWPPEQVRAHMLAVVPQLKHWNQGEN